ncbi:MAG: D-alanyl-D-alanine carboxypeptidase [Rhodospirillales bacterium]|nr:D-alanyl-D-alanine carboxypeptidase [Rhodospirillales bacterium]
MPARRSLLLASLAGLLPAPALGAPPEPAALPMLAGPHPIKRTFIPAATPLGPVGTEARWALITDFNTGATLLHKNSTAAMPPSSMTKLMTLYIVYSMLKAGRLKLDQTLPVSRNAWRTGGSKMFVPLGGEVSVLDLIKGIEVDSGNDACVVLAEGISGSQAAFAELMNRTAAKLHLVNSHFVNATGLPAPGHYMCCRDIATLARLIISEFPEYYRYASQKVFTFSNIKQYNRNQLVQQNLADGLKTGYTYAGGYGLCASALRAGRRIIMVLNGMPTERDRTAEGLRLLDWSFRSFEDVTLFRASTPVAAVPVWLGAAATVPLAGRADLVATLPHGWRRTARIRATYDAPVPAPVSAGQPLGSLLLDGAGVPPARLPLYAAVAVPRLGLAGRAIAVLTHLAFGR